MISLKKPPAERVMYVVAGAAIFFALAIPLILSDTFDRSGIIASFQSWQAITAALTTLSAGALAYAGASRQARMAREDLSRQERRRAHMMASSMRADFEQAKAEFFELWSPENPDRPYSGNHHLFERAFREYSNEWLNLSHLQLLWGAIGQLLSDAALLDREALKENLGEASDEPKEKLLGMKLKLELVLISIHSVEWRFEKEIGDPVLARVKFSEGPVPISKLGYKSSREEYIDSVSSTHRD